ncbi:5-formyltetrahydrofolate cyclo-ligase [Novosphingobium sp. ZN18A2]|uniref:5-formyltetrahydrofolate cyclo-ligase n=1 Tax=Novosphingobium sp. ZN18A2 TaxID=3079861 RepID=UPI0030CA5D8A
MTDPDASNAAGKADLRRKLRAARREHVASLDERVRALLFKRPPAAVAALVPEDATVGLYAPAVGEAPASAYARWFHEEGHPVALPWFAQRGAPMEFRQWETPWIEETLATGPYGAAQPADDAAAAVPGVLFVPLVGFTADGHRLGQGGGHYDRWLDAHPGTIAIGLAWDCQLVDSLPMEPHDHPLHAVVTPTRLYGPWSRDTGEHAA